MELVKQINQRVPDNLDVLEQMNVFNVRECLRPIKPNIIEIVKMFEKDPNIISIIDIQWRNLHKISWNELNNTVNFWGEVMTYTGDKPFGDLSNFALNLLS